MALQRLAAKRTASAAAVDGEIYMLDPDQDEPLSRMSSNVTDSEASCNKNQFHHSVQYTTRSDKSKLNRTLTDEENALTTVLERSFKTALEVPFAPEVLNSLDEMQDYYQTFAYGYAKVVIKFLKGIEDFKQLDMEVQVKCLKGSIQCCFVLIAAYNFDNLEKNFVVNDIRVRLEDLKEAFASYAESTEFFFYHILSMQDTPFKDPCLMAIFALILVFSPSWENLIQRRYISNIQNKYLILMKHYLEANYSYQKGKEYFARIFQKLNSLREQKRQRQMIVAELGDKMPSFAKEIWQG